ELLGPAGGDDEVLDAPPDSRYILGRIAPVKLIGTSGSAPSSATEDPDADQSMTSDDSTFDLGDDLDALESRGVPMSDVDDTSADGDDDAGADDSGQDEPVRRGLMIPASMGLRFQIPRHLAEFTVIASWGTYEPESTGEVTAGGRSIRRFRRQPVDIPSTIRVADLQPGVTTEVSLKDDVVLRIDSYDDEALGRLLVEVALCNDRETPRKIPINAWMFQTALHVEAGGADVFLPVHDALNDSHVEDDDELRRLGLQYRDRLEFAVGRTCSVDWLLDPANPRARRARRVSTTWLPTAETPQVEAKDPPGTVLDMTVLATASPAEVEAGLRPILDGYDSWLDGQATTAEQLPDHLRDEARDAVTEARRVLDQLRAGLAFLVGDPEAMRCFGFMNQAMADQRIQTQIAAARATDPTLSRAAARALVLAQGPGRAHSWRTFQIAFILIQLPALCDPAAEQRSGDLAQVELLFFPTGGGKTEAYLGLAAYAFAVRRRQGLIDSPDGPLDGRAGVTVLMRYTLRLLTAQQFQRATALVCAAELARRADPGVWGEEPFRIGLWVGTDVSPKRVDEAAEQLRRVNEGRGHRLTVLQIQRCPWCGTAIDSRSVRVDEQRRRVFVYCGDDLAECPFSDGGTVDGGLPVLTVDEEIYRLAPAFVIATVDKFARLAREGEAASLFGYVAKRCDRHGFVHPDYQQCDIKDGSKHPQRPGLPAAAVHPHARLRPPDLIIQDELHLITGALGTTVGLFEVAIDALTTWRTASGRTAKPLIVASTATVRNARDQIRALYGRDVNVFPPQVIDVSDTFFSTEVPVTPDRPGRRYVGVSTTGVRLTTAEIRVAEVLMSGAQLVLDRSGEVADPYLTLVGYFNATRELAGMARYMQDDIQTALSKGRRSVGLPRRYGTAYGALNMDELTSRVSGSGITETLDKMATAFDPVFDSTDGRRALGEARERGDPLPERSVNPYDVILATSMLQVGVDVTRLGLMLMVGQPKNTAEYIQASSRVGRDGARPGLVVTLGNWARPRDLAHYEQFRHYHETFYAQVEALSVTPFSVTSLERGLDGVLVSAARVLDAARPQGLSPERSAGRVVDRHDAMTGLIEALVARVLRASDEPSQDLARQRLLNRLGAWEAHRALVVAQHKSLAYERVTDRSTYAALVRSAESGSRREDGSVRPPLVVANSMREVQPEINLLVSPDPDRLHHAEPVTAPQWSAQSGGTS
ncbi:DISARM system helicase DrmA, partial [Lapillicoccus sp.]|uniref:DISARM system helicase DrmA n=1 Tax=Lapillicoccus sp. TaxID=1909287 RepID=UPI0025F3E39D